MPNPTMNIRPSADGNQHSEYPTGNYQFIPAPTLFSATVSGTTVNFSFSDNSGGTAQHIVYQSNDNGVTFNEIATLGPTVTVLSRSGFTPGNYQFQIRGALNGAFSAWYPSPVSVSVVGGGGLADGDTVTVTIPGAGSNIPASQQAFLGGSWGIVESAALNAEFGSIAPAPWGSPGNTPTTVSNARALNGSKSLLNNRGIGFGFGINYDTGVEQGAMWATWTYYMHNPDNVTMQLKQLRFVGSNGGGGTTADYDYANCYFTSLPSNATQRSAYLPVNTATSNRQVGSVNSGYEAGYTGSWYQQGIWVKNEATIIRNSAAGVADGRLVIVSKNAETGEVIGRRVIPAYDFSQGDPFLRYVTWQGYMGNFSASPDNIRLYLDRDFYIAWNSARAVPKTLKVGNASTYAACTTFIEQQFISWNAVGANADITFRFNQGRLPSAAGNYAYALSDADTPINTNGVLIQ